jgi:hypothetical protein
MFKGILTILGFGSKPKSLTPPYPTLPKGGDGKSAASKMVAPKWGDKEVIRTFPKMVNPVPPPEYVPVDRVQESFSIGRKMKMVKKENEELKKKVAELENLMKIKDNNYNLLSNNHNDSRAKVNSLEAKLKSSKNLNSRQADKHREEIDSQSKKIMKLESQVENLGHNLKIKDGVIETYSNQYADLHEKYVELKKNSKEDKKKQISKTYSSFIDELNDICGGENA